MKRQRLLPIALLACFAAGCSGSHGAGFVPMPTGAQSVPSVAARKGTALLTLSMVIPRRTRTRADYVSASTESIKIVEGKTTIGTFNTTPTTKGCLRKNKTTVCTYHMGAIPGKNEPFEVSTYDGQDQGGRVLSTDDVRKTIAASKQNTLNLTLNGVEAAISLKLSNDTPTQGSPVKLNLTVTATDADGNTIVGPGSYASAISLADSDKSVAKLGASRVTSPSKNVVIVTCTCAAGSATFTASAKGVTNATAKLTSVKPHSEYVGGVWTALPGYGSVAYYTGNQQSPDDVLESTVDGFSSASAIAVDDVGGVIAGDTSGNIAHWAINATGDSVPSQFVNVSGSVSALAWDPINERIIYATAGSSSFCVLPSNASGSTTGTCYTNAQGNPLSTTVSGLAVNPKNGDLYVANATMCCDGGTGNYVAMMVYRPGNSGSYLLDHRMTYGDYAFVQGQIAFDATDDRIWETEPDWPQVDTYDPSDTSISDDDCSLDTNDVGITTPQAIAWDGEHGVWVGDSVNTQLTHFTDQYDSSGSEQCDTSKSTSLQLGPGNGNISPINLALFRP